MTRGDRRLRRFGLASAVSERQDEVRAAAAEFVGHIGRLSDDPEVRAAALRTAVRETSWRLLEEFGDHYALAEQLEIASRLAWWGPDALRAAGIVDTVEPRRAAAAAGEP